jgi:hypothetical protein
MTDNFSRKPYKPNSEEWTEVWEMLCGHCSRAGQCEVVEKMIEMKRGAPWPEGGWVTDPGAGVTCLSYQPKHMVGLSRQQLRQAVRQAAPMCSGCAAQKGSEASVSLHTRRDFSSAVKYRAHVYMPRRRSKGPAVWWLVSGCHKGRQSGIE